MKNCQATEIISLEQAQEKLQLSGLWTNKVLDRLSIFLPAGKIRILEIGSAQGRSLISLAKLGHHAFGIEPYAPAREIANQLANQECVEIDLREGCAESIPFESNSFDLVLAFAVMEHVTNLEKSLEEISRVLKPGGIFWFSSASALCPLQNEIRGFPFFGWYPDPLKKKIMLWSVKNKPELIGFTEHPAYHWWTPSNTRVRLKSFSLVVIGDRWTLRRPNEDHGPMRYFFQLASRYPVVRLIGDIFFPGCSYAARKN